MYKQCISLGSGNTIVADVILTPCQSFSAWDLFFEEYRTCQHSGQWQKKCQYSSIWQRKVLKRVIYAKKPEEEARCRKLVKVVANNNFVRISMTDPENPRRASRSWTPGGPRNGSGTFHNSLSRYETTWMKPWVNDAHVSHTTIRSYALANNRLCLSCYNVSCSMHHAHYDKLQCRAFGWHPVYEVCAAVTHLKCRYRWIKTVQHLDSDVHEREEALRSCDKQQAMH